MCEYSLNSSDGWFVWHPSVVLQQWEAQIIVAVLPDGRRFGAGDVIADSIVLHESSPQLYHAVLSDLAVAATALNKRL